MPRVRTLHQSASSLRKQKVRETHTMMKNLQITRLSQMRSAARRHQKRSHLPCQRQRNKRLTPWWKASRPWYLGHLQATRNQAPVTFATFGLFQSLKDFVNLLSQVVSRRKECKWPK